MPGPIPIPIPRAGRSCSRSRGTDCSLPPPPAAGKGLPTPNPESAFLFPNSSNSSNPGSRRLPRLASPNFPSLLTIVGGLGLPSGSVRGRSPALALEVWAEWGGEGEGVRGCLWAWEGAADEGKGEGREGGADLFLAGEIFPPPPPPPTAPASGADR
ncbi:hypothetical protein DACRYDRAFT_107320 [Dacryopinax primogenitus]|uniref:Uncharacterized protein n=1 Tax=Dacryopinax primogenitus (strain DJM 731) TaxID=1858805 RepID=M5GDH4_DACPD|nr:uncharacterized protein DACRYDRAFT_107320 [Dacryopinax primogenitus]EJU02398.1 hypothetical protein DACRYDRAFT_107320 [Dacryopinax primogenitus]